MRYSFAALALSGSAALVAAQGAPDNTTICDYYTTALLKDNTPANQATILTLVVNTAVIGNYTKPEIEGVTFPDVAVPGILNPNGTYEGTPVNLVPYFNGDFASTNQGGDSGVSVNFLDGGGAEPLMNNTASNDPNSRQEALLTSLYSYFGTLLGCSGVGQEGFPAYSGSPSQYRVHQFMALDTAEVSYFIQQVGLSAASFGVAESDVTKVGETLNGAFNVRCAAPIAPIPSQDAELQSICIADDCMEATNSTCDAYEPVVEPDMGGTGGSNATATGGSGMPTSTGGSDDDTASSTASPTGSGAGGEVSPGAASQLGAGVFAAGAAAAAAFFL